MELKPFFTRLYYYYTYLLTIKISFNKYPYKRFLFRFWKTTYC